MVAALCAAVACKEAEPTRVDARVMLGSAARLTSQNYARFESGNIGKIRRPSPRHIEMSLRSDNDDALPPFWRQWFYTKLDNLPVGQDVTITIKGGGHWNYYLPVYSYDRQTWHHFSERQTTQPTKHSLAVTARFKSDTVWVARYVPYTYTHLNAYLKRLDARRGVTVGDIGRTREGRIVPTVTITDSRVPLAKKRRVLIHARTHPGEVGSSFLLEGMLDYLSSNSRTARAMRKNLVFDVVPMLNVDGVVAGNNRVTPYGVNLEGKWYSDPKNPLRLDARRAPHEVRLWHARIMELLREPAPVTVALNLHASAGQPEDGVFFFPHFGARQLGYRADEASLFGRQMRFIEHFIDQHGPAWFNRPPTDGTRAMASKNVPESWWWRNFNGNVMALSIESTYGRVPGGRRWVSPDDMRALGKSLARALARYHQVPAK
jgi:murein tripeptide amidase MpaA